MLTNKSSDGVSGYLAAVMADSPVLYWRLGETAGASTAVDASGNGRNGTYSFGTTLGVAGLITGDSNTAASFDGIDDRLTYGTALSSTPTISYEFWVKSTATSGRLISDPELRVVSGKLDLLFVPSGGGALLTAINVLDGNRHHVVVTYGSGSIKVYVDGTLFKSGAGSGNFSAASVNLGGSGGGSNSWAGILDEFAIYGTELSSVRISAHYAAA